MQYLHSLRDHFECLGEGHIRWAAKAIEGYDVQKRVPHEEQSKAASQLLENISLITPFSVFRSSRSHSRAIIATAASDHTIDVLGIDVESTIPIRAFDGIVGRFAEDLPTGIDRPTFYWVWTFLEAHFKAFQSFPSAQDIRLALDRSGDGKTWQTPSGIQIFQRTVLEQFCLSLVWKSSKSAPISLSHNH
jgi:hypothetical protein